MKTCTSMSAPSMHTFSTIDDVNGRTLKIDNVNIKAVGVVHTYVKIFPYRDPGKAHYSAVLYRKSCIEKISSLCKATKYEYTGDLKLWW